MISRIPIVLERANVNDETVTLVRWFIEPGRRVEVDDLVAEVETSKANMEVHAQAAGFLVQSFAEGSEVPVGTPIGFLTLGSSSTEAANEVASEKHTSVLTPTISQGGMDRDSPEIAECAGGADFPVTSPIRQRFSPLATKMMETNGLTAADFPGRSIVRKQDVLDRLNPRREAIAGERPGTTRSEDSSAAFLPPITQPHQRITLSKMKRREGESLSRGMANSVPSAVSVVCFTKGLRRIIESRIPGGNASALIVHETSKLLRKYPSLNAAFRNGEMVSFEQVNIGYAMDDGSGLKVVVLRECHLMPLQDIQNRLRELTLAYLNDKLTPAELANPTFTISDLSGMEVSSFYPLISENQGAILGVGGEQFAPGVVHGSYTLTLTFDHQLSDGRTAALFLNDLKRRLMAYEDTTSELQTSVTCTQCGRTEEQLRRLNQHLLRSALPEGYLCSLCVAGY